MPVNDNDYRNPKCSSVQVVVNAQLEVLGPVTADRFVRKK